MDKDYGRLPVIYFGHGNPMNAILENSCTDGWRSIGGSLPRPRAILCVSAHWYITSTRVTSMERPRTIHDFGGFPRELYEVQYPAPGDPVLARRVVELLRPTEAILDDQSWGLDHGTWSVLAHVFRDADIPVVQLSVDETQPPSFHYELGRKLAPLRDEGVLVIGSGNLVHNLHAYSWGRRPVEPFKWAVRFETEVRRLLEGHEHGPLVDYESLGPDALLSIPTPDHYLPLLYVIAGCTGDDDITYPVEGVDGGSISMLTVRLG